MTRGHGIQAWPVRGTHEWLSLWTREGSVRVLSGQGGAIQVLWQPCAVAGVLQHGGGTLAIPAHGSPGLPSFLHPMGPPIMLYSRWGTKLGVCNLQPGTLNHGK